MSKIAEALAKAKERTGHTTAPFMSGAPVTPVAVSEKKAAALRKARRLQRFWLVLSSVALVLTAFILWERFGDIEPPEAVKNTTTPSGEVSSPVSERPSRLELVTEAPVPVVLPTENAGEAGSVAGTAPEARGELQAVVNAWVFTAVMPGERPRLMYKGRIVGVGERVEGELVFAGIHDGRLVFNDAQGAIYQRRY
jgi:hypothetical protein